MTHGYLKTESAVYFYRCTAEGADLRTSNKFRDGLEINDDDVRLIKFVLWVFLSVPLGENELSASGFYDFGNA
jgi:hypothetical protein